MLTTGVVVVPGAVVTVVVFMVVVVAVIVVVSVAQEPSGLVSSKVQTWQSLAPVTQWSQEVENWSQEENRRHRCLGQEVTYHV